MNSIIKSLFSLPCRHRLALGIAGCLAWIPSINGAEPNFEAQTIDPNILIGYGVVTGDVDGDGDQDVLVADKRDFWWYENPSWEKHLFHTFHQGEDRIKLRDNVCIAARDIDGDGKVEVAVGGNWNPGNTASEEESGSVYFLGSLGKVKPVKLPHDPTTHRMRWVRTGQRSYSLVVLPLHGRAGTGKGANVTAYTPPANPFADGWKTAILSNEMNKTHNFDTFADSETSPEQVLVGGAEGALLIHLSEGKWISTDLKLPDMNGGAGEIRRGLVHPASQSALYACIEPMHGNSVAVYQVDGSKGEGSFQRTVLDETLNQGHALAVADVLGTGNLQIIAGWRNPNTDGKVGIKLYAPDEGGKWTTHLIDDNKMACEDLKVVDLNKDGKLDIVACGRDTRNLVIYWNKG